jgi:hypothetical protein
MGNSLFKVFSGSGPSADIFLLAKDSKNDSKGESEKGAL